MDVAWAKSAAREGSLGEVRVVLLAVEEKPWNWEVMSPYCFWREGRESAMACALLLVVVSLEGQGGGV